MTKHGYGVLLASLLATISVSAPATAGSLDFLWPASSEELGPIDWSGINAKPDLGFITIKFSGSGGDQLGDAEGFSAGGEFGYDQQIGSVVVGVAANLLWSGAEGGEADGSANDIETTVGYYGAVRARLGYAMDRFMVFGTGGVAFTDLEIDNITTGVAERQDLVGWVAGGGVEWRFSQRLNLRGEFQHVEFGETGFSSLGGDEVSSSMNLFKFGMVHRF